MKLALNRYIDHTLLRPDAVEDDILKLCDDAIKYEFAAVCVQPVWAKLAGKLLEKSPCKLCSVVGFPLGANLTLTKALETKSLIELGVQEIDMVIHVGALKVKDEHEVVRDIEAVVQAAGGSLVKVILETCLLTDEEKRLASQLAVKAGAHFVKTSTGFAKAGATVHDVALMRQAVGPKIGVKASGGIHDYKSALAMIEAGATRLGTSKSVEIVVVDQ